MVYIGLPDQPNNHQIYLILQNEISNKNIKPNILPTTDGSSIGSEYAV